MGRPLGHGSIVISILQLHTSSNPMLVGRGFDREKYNTLLSEVDIMF